MKRVVIAGGSGLVGSHILTALSQIQNIAITSLVRKIDGSTNIPSLSEVTFDFNNPNEYKKIGSEIKCDIFYCCIGTTIRKAKSAENFLKVDRDYPIQFIENIKMNSPNTLFVYISSIGAANPRGLYLNAKCDVEKSLTKSLLPYIIARPSLLIGKRKEFRPAEQLGGIIFNKIDNFLKKYKINDTFAINKYVPIKAIDVANCLVYRAMDFDKTVPGIIIEGSDFNIKTKL
ncbi:NAD-dependent epimerase/dehydratase family protein [Fluviispira multicolorata]|uniref:NAD-dependent epimerase/dehydratase family protein n=1 Tax=Fluviispira multicolorata TaxID=2654512 RepID=A0A833N2F7_9BACT|nr:NAD-dependent epimerase/dehydratase family protein [Fluviispira multicolorata]KAB8028072.1 NAD-dependent epimerase/dehydratase family protein [Fluviispira multicolorata]